MSTEAVVGFWQKVSEDSAFAKNFHGAMPEEAENTAPLVKFAHENGFDFTGEELAAVAAGVGTSSELSDEQLESVSGGDRAARQARRAARQVDRLATRANNMGLQITDG